MDQPPTPSGCRAPRLPGRQKWGHAWRALRHENYRRYFLGQAVSILGNWLQQVAQGWLVYRLSGSTLLLGASAFLSQVPQLIVAPLAGIVIDRSNIRRLMLLVQSAMLLQALVLALITWAGWVEAWHLLVASALFGILNSFDVPLRHAFTVELVADRSDLPNAVALNSLFFNLARLLGPPLAGAVLLLGSEATCFAINGLSFVAIMLVLFRLRTASRPPSSASFKAAVAEGLAFIRRSFPVRHILLQVALLNFLAANYIPLMPAFAREVFHGGPNTLGSLLGSAGAGALFASLRLAARPGVRGLSGSITDGILLSALALIAFALADGLWLASAMLFVLGFGIISGNASSNTILQSILSDQLRGRVLALYSAANLGAAALGGLLSGALAERIGPGRTLLVLGGIQLVGAFYFRLRLEWFRMHLRPIYVRLGI